MACFWLSSWAHKVLWSMVVGGEVVDRSVGGVDAGGGLVGGGWVATGAESGGGATVVSGVVVGSELDGGSTDVGRVVADAESGGFGRGAAVPAGVEAGAAVAVELGPTTSPNTVTGSAVAGTSSSPAALVGTADVDVSEVVVAFVNVRAVVVAGAATGVGVGPSPGPPELGPCHSVARTNRTTSSTEMTARATVLPDGRWSALPGCGRSLTSMRQYYPTRRTPPMARSTHSRTPCGDELCDHRSNPSMPPQCGGVPTEHRLSERSESALSERSESAPKRRR
jgi:hypothetical protein